MRRRLATVLCLLIPLVCTACHKPKPADPLTTDFVCEFRAQYNNMTAAGTLTRRTADTLRLDFSEPQTLSGLSAEWNGDAVTLQYLGLSYTVDSAKLPEQALGEQLLQAFNAALHGEGERTEKDGQITVTGLAGDLPYTYVYDSQSGAPLSLTVPALPLSVTFSNVKTSP